MRNKRIYNYIYIYKCTKLFTNFLNISPIASCIQCYLFELLNWQVNVILHFHYSYELDIRFHCFRLLTSDEFLFHISLNIFLL